MTRLCFIGRTVITTVAIVLLVWACSSPYPEDGLPDAEGLITLIFSGDTNRSLLPDVELNVAEYVVTGIGPNNHSFTTTVTSNNVQIDVAAGEWIVSVYGFTSDGNQIAHATAQASVQPDDNTTVHMQLQLYAGEGSLDIIIEWPENFIQHPVVLAALEPVHDGDIIELDFTVQSQQAVFSSSSIPAGYYVLECRVYEEATFVFTTGINAVLIVAEERTTGSFTFSPHDQSGSMDIALDDGILDVISVSIVAPSLEKYQNSPLELHGKVDTSAYITDAAVWEWFLDGSSIGNESRLLLDTSIPEGQYQLDVVVRDGFRAASSGNLLTVLPELEALIIESFVIDPSHVFSGHDGAIEFSAVITEYGAAVVETAVAASQHVADIQLLEEDGEYKGATPLQLDEPGAYRFEALAQSAAGEYTDSASASFFVLPPESSTVPAFAGAQLEYPDADLVVADKGELVAEPSVDGTGSLHYEHELDGSGTTVTIPLFDRSFSPLGDSSLLTFWFKGKVQGDNPALRLQVAGGGSASNYYDLNGITTGKSYYAGSATSGGSFPVDEIDVREWTRVILDLSNVDWSANGGSAADDYVLTVRMRTGSSHNWYLDNIRFEP